MTESCQIFSTSVIVPSDALQDSGSNCFMYGTLTNCSSFPQLKLNGNASLLFLFNSLRLAQIQITYALSPEANIMSEQIALQTTEMRRVSYIVLRNNLTVSMVNMSIAWIDSTSLEIEAIQFFDWGKKYSICSCNLLYGLLFKESLFITDS